MLILNYTYKLRSFCSCWLDSWATVWISESLSFCFNFSKTGYDEWLSQYLVWTYEWLNNVDEFGEVKGTNTLLHFFPVYEKTLETGQWERKLLNNDSYLCSNSVYGLLFESLIKIRDYISLINIHTWTIVTVNSKHS